MQSGNRVYLHTPVRTAISAVCALFWPWWPTRMRARRWIAGNHA